MTLLSQLQQIERVSAGGPFVVYYYLTGWKGCRYCGHIIRWDNDNCPTCGWKLSRTPRTKKGKDLMRKLLANPAKKLAYIQKVAKIKGRKHCSKCSSIHTSNSKIRYGKRYPIWLHDGKGGYLCAACYRRINAI